MLFRSHAARITGLVLIGISFMGAVSRPGKLSEKLSQIRGQVLDLEKNLLDGVKDEKNAVQRLKTLRSMITLQRQERVLGHKRMIQLENFISELENRRGLLRKRV